MDSEHAHRFLNSLINKNLRIFATDGRMFMGQFKCTDAVRDFQVSSALEIRSHALCFFSDPRSFPAPNRLVQKQNVVLQNTYEYREPSPQQRAEAAAAAAADPGAAASIKLDMTSRFLGLITISGEYIVKMEVEEFESQMRTHNPYTTGDNPYADAHVI